MEYKRVKPILYDRGVPKYQVGGLLQLARVVPGLLGATGVAATVAGAAKNGDYTGPSDQEIRDFIWGNRWAAPPIEGYVGYPNYNEIIESQKSETPIGDIYIPEQHRTAASIPARPIPVSYEAVAKGDTIDTPQGRAVVEDIDPDGRMILGPTIPTPAPQNPRDKKPEDDKEKDKKNKKFLSTVKNFIFTKGTTTPDKALQSILWETKGNNWGTILGTNKGLRNWVGRIGFMYPALAPIVAPEAVGKLRTGIENTVNGIVDELFGSESTPVTTPATPTTTTPNVSYEDSNDSIEVRLNRLRSKLE